MPMSNDEAHRARAVRPVSIVASGTDSLLDSLPVASGRARTRQLLKAKGVRVLRLSFDAGQVLGDRIESAAMLVQTLRGRVTLSVAGEDIDMPAGAIVHLERELPHSFAAVEASHLMITLLGPRLARPRATSHAPELSHPMLAVGSNGRRSVAGGEHAAQSEWAARNLVLAASGANAVALDAITRRHGELLGQLAARTARLLDLLAAETAADSARHDLVAWAHEALLPQLELEAEVLYPLVPFRTRALVATLRQQLNGVIAAVERLATQHGSVAFDVAASAVALRVSVGRHLTVEAEQLLPTLAAAAGEPLALLWRRMDESIAVPLGA
jgi:quercetin dioxygenase-like cupin family protein